MLQSYFQYRTHLAKTGCLFHCPKTCAAPGCRSSDIIVEVTIFDLIGLGQMLDTSVSSLFFDHCRLGLQNVEFNPRYKRLLLKLIKPCPFHRGTHCAVHDLKPLNCVLFPEYHQLTDLLSTLSTHQIFSTFPCLDGNITISNKRRDALTKLNRIGRMEEAVSSYFLFGIPAFIIDSKPLDRELRIEYPKMNDVSQQEYDKFFSKKLKQVGFFDFVMENLIKLDSYSEIVDIFKILDQDNLTKPLLAQITKPKIIYMLKKNRIKKLKRKLGTQALTYMVFRLP